MAVHIDISRAHLTRRHGDILAIYTWLDDERALVLMPAYRRAAGWYCLLDSAAYKYAEPEYLARQSAKAAEVLGMEPSPNNWLRIATIILEGLPDLISMPSAPEKERARAAYGELKVFQDGQLIGGEEVRPEIESGVVYE